MHKSALNQDVIHHILLWASTARSDGIIANKAPVVPGFESSSDDDIEVIKKHVNYLVDKGWMQASAKKASWVEYTYVRLLPPGWEKLDSLIREGKIS